MKKRKKEANPNTLSVRNSRKIYIPVYLMVLVLIAIIALIYFTNRPLTLFSIALVIVFSYFAIKFTEIHRLTNKYEIENASLVHTSGFFSKNERRVDLFAISDANVIQSFWQRIWRYGDVHVKIFSTDTATIIKSINNPAQFAKFLEARMLKLRRGKKDD